MACHVDVTAVSGMSWRRGIGGEVPDENARPNAFMVDVLLSYEGCSLAVRKSGPRLMTRVLWST